MRRDPRTGREGVLTCGFAGARIMCGVVIIYAEMTLVTLTSFRLVPVATASTSSSTPRSLGIDMHIVQRTPGTRGFTPLPKRWTVERTYGWLMLHRRLARDHETLPARSETMNHLAMTDLMARRLTGSSPRTATVRRPPGPVPSQPLSAPGHQ
ncbi:hypothetical protein Srubr_05370 [Streptomyces rubradiris]|uniref:Transposase DDE domain-containing protein n=1 Tax=Streptomyces rubradiris TaxID=285531 RepID=A0ABQ3R4B2_STRRR|nr:hypothetical protein GCM10018792_24440 [Streptomyces rubradiris]GHI50691.1 hypothetical protein Srubr_05370 [Streptomyces rubradiris]